jgi:hypothetical protein
LLYVLPWIVCQEENAVYGCFTYEAWGSDLIPETNFHSFIVLTIFSCKIWGNACSPQLLFYQFIIRCQHVTHEAKVLSLT